MSEGQIERVARAIALSRFTRQHPYIPTDKIKDIIPDALDREDARAAIAAMPTAPVQSDERLFRQSVVKALEALHDDDNERAVEILAHALDDAALTKPEAKS